MNYVATTATDPDMQAVFEERARALALTVSEDESTGEAINVLVLALGDERYGVEIGHMREIEPLEGITVVPGTPPHWAGIVNLRGSMYPVLDLRRHLGLSGETPEISQMKVSLVQAAGLTVGLLVDDVAEIRRVALADLAPPMTSKGAASAELFTGTTADMLSVLDLEALLADPSLVVEEEVR